MASIAASYLIPRTRRGLTWGRNSSVVIATAGSSRSALRSVDLVNGKKVNGVHIPGEKKGSLFMEEPHVEGNKPLHDCLLGRFVEQNFVYGQTFIIRSYEIGPDKTATMETLMNLLQV